MVRRVWKMLGLQTKRAELSVSSANTLNRAVQAEAHIELNPGFGGPDFHKSSGRGVGDRTDLAHLARRSVQDEVVVVAAGAGNLRVACADRGWLAEIERCAGNGLELPGRNQRRVDRCVAVGLEFEDLIQDVAAAGARKIEVTMVG